MPLRTFMAVCCLAGPLLLAGPARADVVVVVSQDSPVSVLSPDQVSDLYLGRLRNLPNGSTANVIEQQRDSRVREQFFRLLNGMTLKQTNAYWARLQFSGQVLPPLSLTDGKAVLTTVRSSPTAIGYIDSSEVDDSVRVVLHLKTGAGR